MRFRNGERQERKSEQSNKKDIEIKMINCYRGNEKLKRKLELERKSERKVKVNIEKRKT